MNKDLIFREPVYNSENQFMHFHYWGFNTEEGSTFTGPTTPTNNIKPKHSEKYIGLLDKFNTPVYDGDIICFNEKYGEKHIRYGVVKGGVRGYCYDIDCGDHMYNSTAYHIISDNGHQGYVIGNIHQGIKVNSALNAPSYINIKDGRSIVIKGSALGCSTPHQEYTDMVSKLTNIDLNKFKNLEEAVVNGVLNKLELNNILYKPVVVKLNFTKEEIKKLETALGKTSGELHEIKDFNESIAIPDTYEDQELTNAVIKGMTKQLENQESK